MSHMLSLISRGFAYRPPPTQLRGSAVLCTAAGRRTTPQAACTGFSRFKCMMRSLHSPRLLLQVSHTPNAREPRPGGFLWQEAVADPRISLGHYGLITESPDRSEGADWCRIERPHSTLPEPAAICGGVVQPMWPAGSCGTIRQLPLRGPTLSTRMPLSLVLICTGGGLRYGNCCSLMGPAGGARLEARSE